MTKFTTLAAAAIVLALSSGGDASAQIKTNLVLGSTASTSGHYVAGVAMSKAFKESIPNVSVTVLETGASVDNIRRLSRNELDLGLVGSDTAVMAIDGLGPFEGKAIPDLVVLYPYDFAALSMAVRQDSGVTSLADLAGKKFSPGIRGSGTETLMRESFKLFKIPVELTPGSVKDAVEATQNRQIVGYAKNGVGPLLDPTVRELIVTTPMRLLGFTPEQEDLVLKNIKGVTIATLPEGIMPGQKAVRVPAIQSMYLTRLAVMNDDTAFAISKAFYEKREYLYEVFGHLRGGFDFRAEALKAEQLGLKLHPGAKKYWESLPATPKGSS